MSRLDVLADITRHIKAGYTVRWNPVSKATCRSVARLHDTSLHVRALQKHGSIVTQCECTYENIDAACNSILQYRHANFESDELNNVRDRLRCFARLVVYSATAASQNASSGDTAENTDGINIDAGVNVGTSDTARAAPAGSSCAIASSGDGGGGVGEDGACCSIGNGPAAVIDRADITGSTWSGPPGCIGRNMHAAESVPVLEPTISGWCWADTTSSDSD